MNAVDRICERIFADAQTQAAETGRQAERQAAELWAGWEEKIEAERRRQQCEAQKAHDSRLAQGRSTATMAARQTLLKTKQKLVDEAFLQAGQRLLSLPAQTYTALCAHLAAEASVTGREELIFSEQERKTLGAAVTEQANRLLQEAKRPAALTLSDEMRPIRGGVIVKNGRIETNCTIEAMVEQLRPELTGKVAAVLFEQLAGGAV